MTICLNAAPVFAAWLKHLRDIDERLMAMVTILIFSYNQPSYLRRALAYWGLSDLSVIVADGSDRPMQCDFPPNVDYLHRPQVSLLDRIAEMARKVTTPYVVFCADDDFIAFNGLKVVTEFLNANPDYSSAQGYYTRFQRSHLNSQIHWYWDYRYASKYLFTEASLESRFAAAMKPPVMHYCYSVMKADALKKTLELFNGVEEISSSTFELSFIPGLMSHGRHATLPVFFGARQSHQSHWGGAIKIDEWVELNSPVGYAQWRLNISRLFQENNALSKEDADSALSNAMAMYLEGIMAKRSHSNSQVKSEMPWRAKIRKQITKRLSERHNEVLRLTYSRVCEIWHLCQMFGVDIKKLNSFKQDWLKIKSVILTTPAVDSRI